jgi:microcystin-dependent protein
MAASNQILPFSATDTTTNLLSQAEYASDPQRPIGNQPGTARSKLVNKVLRQTSAMSAGLAQFLADMQNTDVTDSLNPAQLAAIIDAALDAHFAANLAAAQVVLPGSMMMWPRSTPPTGWIKRNGAAISRTTYSALFSIIGTTFGAGDGSTTFNVPDDRSLFERGWDDSRGVDVGRTFGSEQASQNLSHTHTGTTGGQSASHTHSGTTSTVGDHQHATTGSQFTTWGAASVGTTGFYDGSWTNPGALTSPAGAHNHTITTGAASGDHTHSFTTGGSGGSESRPANRAYLPIIKF